MKNNITYVDGENGEVLIRKKKRKKKYPKINNNKWKILLYFGCAMILVFLIVLALFAIGMSNMKSYYDEGKVVNYNGHTYNFNENLVSLCFIGYDQNSSDALKGRNGQSDFIIVLAYDIENSTLKGLSIPRDTMVEPSDSSGQVYFGLDNKEQLAVAFSYDNGIDKASNNTLESVSRLIYNMPINYYFSLNLEGIAPINDSIGGVSVNALETIPFTDIIKDKRVTLHGENARKYIQWRDENALNSSLMRCERDNQYMKNFYEQTIGKIRDIYIAFDLYNAGLNYASTNLGLPEFMYLMQLALTHNVKSMDIQSLKGEVKQGKDFVEFWPDNTDLYEKTLNMFYVMSD